jgi:hypothetical protein
MLMDTGILTIPISPCVDITTAAIEHLILIIYNIFNLRQSVKVIWSRD